MFDICRFDWLGDQVDASVDGVREVAAGLFEVVPAGEPERGDDGHGAHRCGAQDAFFGTAMAAGPARCVQQSRLPGRRGRAGLLPAGQTGWP
jgi:hypothetical protein